MAKYTETFAEYLNNGNTLPTIFSTISGFGDLFTGTYCDHEIGFETETLFNIKLETYAQLYIPLYAPRITQYTSMLSDLTTAERTQTTVHSGTITNDGDDTNSGIDKLEHSGTVTNATAYTGSETNGGSVTAGAQNARVTEMPINAQTATPSQVTQTDQYINSDTHTKSFTDRADTTTNTFNNKDETTHGLKVDHYNQQTFDNTDTTTFEGMTTPELLAVIKEYKTTLLNLQLELLKEFRPLFMKVY